MYPYLTIDTADRRLHAVMWKLKDPESPNFEAVAKDEFTVLALAAGDSTRSRVPGAGAGKP